MINYYLAYFLFSSKKSVGGLQTLAAQTLAACLEIEAADLGFTLQTRRVSIYAYLWLRSHIGMNPIRLSFGGDRCTVRYNGPVPQWDVPAFGVEWDNPNRGKNSGDLNGKSYFSCRVARAGSFLKSTRVPDPEKSLQDAVIERYVDLYEPDEIRLSAHKYVETVGVSKIHARQARVDAQPILSVRACCVSSLDNDQFSFEALERLDLSANLLSDWPALTRFLASLPHIKSVCLNDNRFLDEYRNGISVSGITELELARTLVKPAEIERVLECFPDLKTLGLAQNRLDTIDPNSRISQLEEVDLSHNLLTPACLSTLCSVRRLNIGHNVQMSDLASIEFECETIDLTGMPQLQHMWTVLESIIKCTEVRLGWPDDQRPYIVARLPHVLTLDGTLVTPQQRQDAEIYTLAAVSRRLHPPLPLTRWQELILMHGEPSRPPNRSIRARLVLCRIDGHPMRIVKDASVQRLVHVAARTLNKPVWGMRLCIGETGKILEWEEAVGDFSDAELDCLTIKYL